MNIITPESGFQRLIFCETSTSKKLEVLIRQFAINSAIHQAHMELNCQTEDGPLADLLEEQCVQAGLAADAVFWEILKLNCIDIEDQETRSNFLVKNDLVRAAAELAGMYANQNLKRAA